MKCKASMGLCLNIIAVFLGVASSAISLNLLAADCTPPPTGLVSWWPGEGSAGDVVGTNNGTLSASGVTYTAGKVGQGFRFDGTNGYVQIPDAPSLKPTNVTVEAWVWLDPNLNNGPTAEYIVFKRNTWTYLFEAYTLVKDRVDNGNGTSSDRFEFIVTRSGNQVVLHSTTAVQRGTWYHVAGTYDGNKSTLYVNGVAEASATPGFALDYDTLPVYIGTSGEPAPYNGKLAGIIDEPSIYGRALSTNEIAAIYQAGNAGKCTSSTPMVIGGPVTNSVNGHLYYLLDGSTWTDAEAKAVTLGGHLATINDAAENNWLLTNFANYGGTNRSLWIGLNDAQQEGSFVWSSGEPVTYTNWRQGEPNGSSGPGEDYAYILGVIPGFPEVFGLWNDLSNVTKPDPIQPALYGVVEISQSNITAPQPPVITDFFPKSGSNGVSVTLIGTNFSSVAANNIVYFGAVRAQVTGASATSLTVVVPVGATFAPITATINGLTAASKMPFLPTFLGGAILSSSSLSGPTNLIAGSGPAREIFGDLDGDGKPDLVVAHVYDGTIWVYRNISTAGSLSPASFAAPLIFTIGGGSDSLFGLTLADLDGDGRLDIVTANRNLNIVSIFQNLSSSGNLTTNSFAARVDLQVAGTPAGVTAMDLDGDGRPEIITVNQTSNTVSILRNLINSASITTNSFAVAVNFATGSGPFDIAAADLDGDGKADLVTANSLDVNTVSVLRNTCTLGNIAFASKVDFPGLSSGGSVAVGDLDGDGKLDLVVGSQSSGQAISVYRNISTLGSIALATKTDFATGGWANAVGLGDLDGDGKPDIAVAVQLPSHLSIFKNLSTAGSFTIGSLGARIDIASGWNPNGVAIGDLDGDGKADIATGNAYDGTVSIYRNVPVSPVPLTITQQPVGKTLFVGDQVSFTVTATGTLPITYQWKKNGNTIGGATNSSLALTNVQLTQAGDYSVTVGNPFGTTNSSAATLAVLVPSCTPAPSGLVAWWAGESNALDNVGLNNGTLFNGATYATGKVGKTFSFNGVSQYVQVPDNNLWAFGSNSFTIEFWAYFNSTSSGTFSAPSGGLFIGNDEGAGSLNKWFFARGGGALEFHINGPTINGGTGVFLVKAPFTPIISQWYHLAVTRNGNLYTIYTNGVAIGSQTDTNIIPNPNALLTLGRAENYYFNGRMDEVSIYSRALSINEIGAIYTSGSTGKCPLPPAPVVITAQPTNQAVIVGDVASFTVGVTGTQPITYQWKRNGNPIGGATNSSLALINVQLGQAGDYSVILNNAAGSTNSGTATLAVQVPSCTPPQSDIISWWSSEANANDAIGANNGFVTNGVISYVAGEVGSAFHYNGAGGYVEVPASPSLNVGLGSGFSIEGWIKPVNIVNQLPLFEWQFDGVETGAHFWISATGGGGAGCLYANILDTGNNSHLIFSSGGILTTNYQHVAMTYDKTTGQAKLFRNGTLVANVNLGIFTPKTTGNVLLGARTYLTGAVPQFNYVGDLDEFSLYKRALSQTEIQAIYAARGEGKCPLPIFVKIAQQPVGQTMFIGDQAMFTVGVTGTQPITYQWKVNGNPIGGATNSSLALTDVQLGQAGDYSVTVSNPSGSTNSSSATLMVLVPSCTPPPTGLVSWWPGESSTVDVYGTNNAVVFAGISYALGKVGQAFVFHTNQLSALDVPASASLDVGNAGGFTVEAWINPTDVTQMHPLFEWNDMNWWGVHFHIAPGQPSDGTPGPGQLYANVVDSSGGWHQLGSTKGIVAAGVFQHVALTYDKASGVATIYCNGQIVSQHSLGSFTPLTSRDLYIGRRPAPSDQAGSFDGLMDEPAVYNRALSQTEIQAIYAARGEGKCPLPPTILAVTPTNAYVNEGATVSFAAAAVGSPVLTYQWQFSGADISGETGSILTLSNVVYAQAGNYDVVVANPGGIVTSSNVVLRVNRAPIADAGATETLVISPNASNAVVVLDGSKSTDPDGDILQFTWFHSGDNNAFASGVVSVVTLPLGTNHLILTVNDGMASGSQAFAVEVITTSEAIDRLMILVQSGSTHAQPLLASLKAALAAIDRSQPDTAINQLQAFKNKVLAQVMPTDPDLANQLLADADAIINALNGGTTPAATPLEITSFNPGKGGKPHMNIHGPAGRVYIVEVSTNLVDWQKIGVARCCGDSTFDFDDQQSAPAQQRYYRVVSPK